MFPEAGKYCRVKPRSMEVVWAMTKKSLEHVWGDYEVNLDYTIHFV